MSSISSEITRSFKIAASLMDQVIDVQFSVKSRRGTMQWARSRDADDQVTSAQAQVYAIIATPPFTSWKGPEEASPNTRAALPCCVMCAT